MCLTCLERDEWAPSATSLATASARSTFARLVAEPVEETCGPSHLQPPESLLELRCPRDALCRPVHLPSDRFPALWAARVLHRHPALPDRERVAVRARVPVARARELGRHGGIDRALLRVVDLGVEERQVAEHLPSSLDAGLDAPSLPRVAFANARGGSELLLGVRAQTPPLHRIGEGVLLEDRPKGRVNPGLDLMRWLSAGLALGREGFAGLAVSCEIDVQLCLGPTMAASWRFAKLVTQQDEVRDDREI